MIAIELGSKTTVQRAQPSSSLTGPPGAPWPQVRKRRSADAVDPATQSARSARERNRCARTAARLAPTLVALAVLGGCRTTSGHPEFTVSRVDVLEPGLSERHVVQLFGPPDEQVFRRFGLETNYPWRGLVYRYHMNHTEDGRIRTNELIFDTSFDPPLLDHYMIVVNYPADEVPEHAALPPDFIIDLPGMSDDTNARCADALTMMGAKPIYRMANNLRGLRFARSLETTRTIAERLGKLIAGPLATPQESESLAECMCALADAVYEEDVPVTLHQLTQRTIPTWVREECQERWWTATPDETIRELIRQYETLRNDAGDQDAARNVRDDACAPLAPTDHDEQSADERLAATRPWTGCIHCHDIVIDYVYDAWPVAEKHVRQLVREACHDATVGIDQPSALIALIYDGLWTEKQSGGTRAASLEQCTGARIALESEALAALEASLGHTSDPQRSRLRAREAMVECATMLTELVYHK